MLKEFKDSLTEVSHKILLINNIYYSLNLTPNIMTCVNVEEIRAPTKIRWISRAWNKTATAFTIESFISAGTRTAILSEDEYHFKRILKTHFWGNFNQFHQKIFVLVDSEIQKSCIWKCLWISLLYISIHSTYHYL